MTFDEIEKAVCQKEDLPGGADVQDKNCWMALSGLYTLFREKKITREDARKRKMEIKENYRQTYELQSRYRAALAQYQEDIFNAKELSGRLCKAGNALEALDIALMLISKMLGESITEKTVRKNLMEGKEN